MYQRLIKNSAMPYLIECTAMMKGPNTNLMTDLTNLRRVGLTCVLLAGLQSLRW